MGQIHSMQKALKEDEELVVWFTNASETLRVMEIFLPSPKLAVLSGHDADHNLTRVISPVDALQLVAKVMKVAAGSASRSASGWSCRRRKIPTGNDARFALVAEGADANPCRARRGGRPAGGRSSQRAARTRRMWPWAKRATASAIGGECAGDHGVGAGGHLRRAVSPWGAPSVHSDQSRDFPPGSAEW